MCGGQQDEPLKGVWRRSPQRGTGVTGQGSTGRASQGGLEAELQRGTGATGQRVKLPEAESFLALEYCLQTSPESP